MQKDEMIISPCSRLEGEIHIQGSKNSVLPIMAASIINEGITVIENCPDIADVRIMADLLKECGCTVTLDKHILTIDTSEADNYVFSENSTRLRASILLLGGALVRFGQVRLPLPGGCAIGKRPINYHADALARMGADIRATNECIEGSLGKRGLNGQRILLPFPSVGATQNILIASAAAKGASVIYNAAREPEIWDLCDYLRNLGCDITGERNGIIKISPAADRKKDIRITLTADRIVAGTILVAAACTTGNVLIDNVELERIQRILPFVRAKVCDRDKVIINNDRRPMTDWVIQTGPFPEFPTDMQSVFMTLIAVSYGVGIIEENVFDTRFGTAGELKKLGADIRIEGKHAYVYGRGHLNGGEVTAPDLRGGAALVIAGLAADSQVRIAECRHIYRGYENLAGDLRSLGAVILEE